MAAQRIISEALEVYDNVSIVLVGCNEEGIAIQRDVIANNIQIAKSDLNKTLNDASEEAQNMWDELKYGEDEDYLDYIRVLIKHKGVVIAEKELPRSYFQAM